MKRSRKDEENVYSKALELISSAGPQGILQSDLWKALNVSSREGSRIALTLEKKGLIIREPVYKDRSKTFKLIAVSSVIKISLDAIDDCPCFSCANLLRCGSGQPLSPEKCEDLTRWLLKS
jgi:DNA-binding Lrp family transcriptional regulator